MKKIVLLAAIGAVCAAPMAAMSGTTAYGQLRYSFNSVDEDGVGAGIDGIRGEDNVSLFGIKGSIGDDIKAFYHLQTGANADGDAQGDAFDQRFFFAGLSGGFGKVAYGRMTNAYKFAGFAMDPFYNMSHVSAGGTFSAGGATYGLSPATNGFTDNALQYTSPDLNGLKLNVSVYTDDSNSDEHGMNLGAHYSAGKYDVGVQFASNDDTVSTIPGIDADGDGLRLHGGYKADGWSVSGSWEKVDVGGVEDVNYLYLIGRYDLSKKTELVGTYGSVDDGAAEGDGFTAGVFHTIAPQTQVYALYSGVSLDTADADPSVFSVGAIHKFSFGN